MALVYRDDQVYFRTMFGGGYWCWFAIKGRPPRSEKTAPAGERLVLCCHEKIGEVWRMKREGFTPRTAAAIRILKRLVREGYAEEI